MAALGGLESLIGSLPADTKRVMQELLRAFAPFLRFGPIENQRKPENFAGALLVSTTATSTGEFDVLHGLGRAPYLMVPVVDLNSSGMETVNVRVSRPADAMRIYLRAAAGSTNKVFAMYVES
jgi:hypothetical protein